MIAETDQCGCGHPASIHATLLETQRDIRLGRCTDNIGDPDACACTGFQPSVEYGQVLAFDTDDPEFARGIEVGMLWREVTLAWDPPYRVGANGLPPDEPPREVHATVRATSAEMVMRIAESVGADFHAELLRGPNGEPGAFLAVTFTGRGE